MGVNLYGSTLTNANLTNCFLNYDGVNFGQQDLSGKKLNEIVGNNLNITNMNLSGSTLTNTNFTGLTMTGVNLSNAKLENTNLENAIDVAGIFNNIRSIGGTQTITTNGVSNIKLPPFCGIDIQMNNLIYTTTPPLTTNIEPEVLNSIQTLNGSALSGVVHINTTANVINNLPNDVKNNIGRLIPINLLKLSIGTNTKINIV